MTDSQKFILSPSTWQHLRIPFSFYLMPVFCFASCIVPEFELWRMIVAFLAIHLFLYPASNGYNSYYDKDEESIGGVETPMPVSKELWRASLLFDLLSIGLGAVLGWQFALALILYGLVSKAYSHPWVRLKKKPIIGWLTVGFFQGTFTFLMVFQAIHQANWEVLTEGKVLYASLLSSAMLLGSYPMTQIYQHQEDGKRGDQTISRMLGINGTFLFTAIFFSISTGGFATYFQHYFGLYYALAFMASLTPVLIYFLSWFYRAYRNKNEADFKSTMRLNQLSAISLNAFYIGMGLWLAFG